MYSVVLMAALTTGGGAQECHFHHGCQGCYSSCYSGCYGCYGGCYGCYGGCYGGCYSCFSAYQCHGCYGCSGWTGCYSCYSCYGPGVIIQPGVPGGTPPGVGGPKPNDKPPEGNKPKKDGDEVRAKLTVQLPEDAKLYVDGILMKTSSAKRSFVTPPLEVGKSYFYVLKAEIERDGQTIVVTGQVVIQPGQDLQATLTEPTAKGSFVVKTNAGQ